MEPGVVKYRHRLRRLRWPVDFAQELAGARLAFGEKPEQIAARSMISVGDAVRLILQGATNEELAVVSDACNRSPFDPLLILKLVRRHAKTPPAEAGGE